MEFFNQSYTIIGNSTVYTGLVALIPIIYFLLALTVFKMKGYIASLTTMILAAVVGFVAFSFPVASSASAGLLGILSGLWPIGWIVIWAIFIYNITVQTGKFEAIAYFIGSVSKDTRIQVLLIALGFGVFLEGVAGFGIPIAIGASLLIGLGMKNPILAAAVCLVANLVSAPVGAIGIPVTVAAKVTGVDAHILSVLISRQLTLLTFVAPFWLVAMVDGFKGIKETFATTLTVAIVGAVTVFFVYDYVGHELADIILGIVLMLTVYIASKVFHKHEPAEVDANKPAEKHYSGAQILFAWSPFIAVTVFALIWTNADVKAFLNSFTVSFKMPELHGLVHKATLIDGAWVTSETAENAIWNFDILKCVGTALFIAAIYTVIAFRAFGIMVRVFAATIKQLVFPILTICFVLGFAKVADYSGQTASIAYLLANTGKVYPVLAPLLGMLGVFLTGSVVNSNTLFAKVQILTGHAIGVNPELLAASNTIGSSAGKIISPQSIAIGCAATGQQGQEGQLLTAVLKHALFFIVFICLMTVLQAYVLQWTAHVA